MRAVVLVAILACAGGCELWHADEPAAPLWTLPFGENDEVIPAVTETSDGDVMVAITNHGGVAFGDTTVTAPFIAHVSGADGTAQTMAAPEAIGTTDLGVLVAVAPDGGAVVVWSSLSSLVVVRYTSALERRWTTTVPGFGLTAALDVGADGSVAVGSTDAGDATPTITALGPDGSTRWTSVPAGGVGRLRVADNGDVFAIGAARVRLAAATGAVIDTLPLPAPPVVMDRDGSFIAGGYAPDGSASAIISRYDAAAQLRWSRTFAVDGFGGIVESSTGDVLVRTSTTMHVRVRRDELLVLDGATGATTRDVPVDAPQSPFAADAQRYFTLGALYSLGAGLAAYAQP